MKTAILLSGHMRTFDRCLPTLEWHIFRHFPGADFFISTVQDADAEKWKLLQRPERRVEIAIDPEQPDCIAQLRAQGCHLPTSWTKGQPYTHEPHPISVHPQAVARQLWQLQQCWDLFTSHLSTLNAQPSVYDIVIRCRPDLWFHGCEVYSPLAPFPIPNTVACTPWWGKFGGVNDRFAFLGTEAAQAYFTTYAQIPALLAAGCPFHPESLVHAALCAAGCEIQDDLRADFSTLRPADREHPQPWFRPPEISTTDLAHCALAAARG